MDHPKVFTIILNWNGHRDTLECLESVFKLDYPNFKVIVVDNGSTDDSVTVIHKTYPQVMLIENRENLGYTGGNNIAMRYAMEHGADYMWLLNNDTVIEPDTLSKLVAVAGESPDIGLVCPVIYYYHAPDRVQFCGTDVDWTDFLTPVHKSTRSWQRKDVKKSVSLVGTALLIKRSVIEKVGYLNGKYFAYGEDNDYSIRVAKAGYENVVVMSARIYHKDSGSTKGQKMPLQVFLRARNYYFLWMDNLTGLKRCRYFLRYLAHVISYSAMLNDEGSAECVSACLDGAWSALRGIGGQRDETVEMPRWLKRIFYCFYSWHPYFWVGLLRGNFLSLYSEVIRRSKTKIVKMAMQLHSAVKSNFKKARLD